MQLQQSPHESLDSQFREHTVNGNLSFLFGRSEKPDDADEKPYNAIASDFDGVVTLYGQETRAEAERIRELLIERTLAKGVPLAFITGKDAAEVEGHIIAPIREMIRKQGIDLPPRQFMVYANNGSVAIDVGLDNQELGRKDFKYEDLEKISGLEIVQLFMAIYDIFQDIRSKFPEELKATRFREERSTLGFSVKPDDLTNPNVKHLYERLLQLAGKEKDLTRFDIGEIFRSELEQAGLNNMKVAVTDGAVDITPPGSGKRQALEDFAERHDIKVEDVLRLGDNGDGSDFELLAAKDNETRPGFNNRKMDYDRIETMQNNPQYEDFVTPPIELRGEGTQFKRVIDLLENEITTAPAIMENEERAQAA